MANADHLFDKIFEKLDGIDEKVTKVEGSVESIQADNKRHHERLEDHHVEIYGKKDIKGLRTRTDNLESANERQTWLLRTALGGMIVTGIGWLMNFFGWGK